MHEHIIISMYKAHSILKTPAKKNQLHYYLLDFDDPSNWTTADVIQWLMMISLQAYCENFRKNEIDGSILMDEIDGINDNTIKQLIKPLGTQLKFKKALRILRNYAYISKKRKVKQEAEEYQKIIDTIQQQSKQITLLIETIHSQTKQIEKLLGNLSTTKKSVPLYSFNQLSSIVQNQLLNLPSNTSKINLTSSDSPSSSIPIIDSLTPSILSLPTNCTTLTSITPVPTSITGPKDSNDVLFPAVVHPNLNSIAIKPVINDIYHIDNYGKYLITIYDEKGENSLVETSVNLVPENEICMPKKFIVRDSVNNILMGATVQIKLRDQIVFTGKTDSTGTIILPTTLPKNCYDVEINTGNLNYKSLTFRMIVYDNRGNEINTQFICRQLDSNQLELVLKWNAIPRDLDAHVFVSDGRHIYFRSKIQKNISLDYDVTNGYGPETMKITLEPYLKYLYVVHRFSPDGLLTQSGATVTINTNNSKIPDEIIHIPLVNQPNANFWIVCEIDGTTKTIQMFENTFEYHNYFSTNDIQNKYFNKQLIF